MSNLSTSSHNEKHIKEYISKFSAVVTAVYSTSIGTIYIIVNIYGIDRGTGDRYIVNTLIIDIPQKIYLGIIATSSSSSSDSVTEVYKLIAADMLEMIPESLRFASNVTAKTPELNVTGNADFVAALTKNIDLGPMIKWKYPIRKKGETWKCAGCRRVLPEHAIRWSKKGSIITRNYYCYDCGIIMHKTKRKSLILGERPSRRGVFVLSTYKGSFVVFTESDAEIYMSAMQDIP